MCDGGDGDYERMIEDINFEGISKDEARELYVFYKKMIEGVNFEGISKNEKQKFSEIFEFLTKFFEEIDDLPCHDKTIALQNRKIYNVFENDILHLTFHSRYEYLTSEINGWSFTINQIEFAQKYQRRGFCTFLFKWILAEMPTSFLFVQSVVSVSMENFLKKMGAEEVPSLQQNYYILKKIEEISE